MSINKKTIHLKLNLLLLLTCCVSASAQTTVFTYQGKLTDNGNPGSGNYDLQFTLFDALSGGTQQGSSMTISTVSVSNGIFTVMLDFGANVFTGAARFLEIGVRPTGSVNPYTVLTPRQPITSSPYAIQTLKSASADGLSATCVGCVQDSQINSVAGTKITGTLPAASLPPGSANYIQNSPTKQIGANFNIDGNALIGGSVGIGTTTAQSPLELQTPIDFYGITHTDGTTRLNTFVNSFLGGAGGIGTQSNHSLFFYAGNFPQMLIDTSGRVGIGTLSPQSRLHVQGTSWFQGDTTPLPASAGQGVAVGYLSGFAAGYILPYDYAANAPKNLLLNSLGGNVGIGTFTPIDRLSVQTLTSSYGFTHTDGTITVGSFVGSGGGWYGTKSNHPLFFFANNGSALMAVTPAGNIGVGTVTPQARFNVSGNTWLQGGTTQLPPAAGKGLSLGFPSIGGTGYIFAYDYGTNTPQNLSLNSTGGNVGIGTADPVQKLTVVTPTSAIGISHTDGTVLLGTFIAPASGAPNGYYGTFTNHPFSLVANQQVGLTVGTTGLVKIVHFSNAGIQSTCFNSSFELSICSSSLRYKTNLAPYRGGLKVINRLRPITFDWKKGGMHDLGFGAEDVEKIDPLLVTYNAEGQVEGVKYDRISAALVNAVKEQQTQIDDQQRQLQQQQATIDSLKKLVCQSNPQADICSQPKLE
jgi:hypothetical protein